MKRLLWLGMFLWPVVMWGQGVDTALMKAEVDSLIKISLGHMVKKENEQALVFAESAKQVILNNVGRNHASYADCIQYFGFLYDRMGNIDKAITAYSECLEVRAGLTGKMHKEYAKVLFSLGSIYRTNNNYEKAIEFFSECLKIRGELEGEEQEDYINTLYSIGLTYQGLQNYEKAIEVYSECLKIREKLSGKQHPEYAKALGNLANAYRDNDQFDEAISLMQESKAIIEKVYGKNHEFYGISLSNLAILYDIQGDYEKSIPLFIETIDVTKAVLGEEHPQYAFSLNNLAEAYQREGRFEDAVKLFQKVLEILKKAYGPKHPRYASGLNNLATLYHDIGNYEQAKELHIEGSIIRKEVLGEESVDYGQTLFNLGTLYESLGEYRKAEENYLRAKAIVAEKLGAKHSIYSRILNNLALLYSTLGNYDLAEQYVIEAQNIIVEKLGKEHLNYAINLHNFASFYSNIGDYNKAEEAYRAAMGIREKVVGRNHIDYASSLKGLAGVFNDMDQYQKAESLYLEVKALYETTLGKEHPFYGNTLSSLGTVYYNQENYSLAKSYFEEALGIYEESFGEKSDRYFIGCYNLFLLYFKTRNKVNANEFALKSSVLQRQILSNATLHLNNDEFSKYLDKYKFQFDAYLSANHIFGGTGVDFSKINFNNSLFYKELSLNLAKRLISLVESDPSIMETYRFLQSYNYLLAKEYAKPIDERKHVAEWEAKANEIEKELIRTVAGFGEALRQVNWQEVQSKLQPGEVAIEFIDYRFYDPEPTDSIFYSALLLRHGDEAPQFVPLFEEQKIAALVSAASKQRVRHINNFYSSWDGAFGEQLYQLIWKPLESHLKDVKKVYCSPSGLLHRINLGAIPIDGQTIFSDHYKLITLGSTRQLVIPTATEVINNDAFIIGGIQYDTDTIAMALDRKMEVPKLETSLPDALTFQSTDANLSRGTNLQYLPSTLQEATEIQALLQKQGYSVQLDTAYFATEEAFRQQGKTGPSSRVLHIATHGYFFPDPGESEKDTLAFQTSQHPMIRSGLLLAGSQQAYTSGKGPDNREDGVLTAYEISQMDLSNTELVVLSACETGLGDIDGNEGVYGLQRAFKIAGAKYLIMSLWQVQDNSSRELMVDFYTQWLEKGLSIPEAFRAAQQNMRRRYSGSPYQWAGFVLVE